MFIWAHKNKHHSSPSKSETNKSCLETRINTVLSSHVNSSESVEFTPEKKLKNIFWTSPRAREKQQKNCKFDLIGFQTFGQKKELQNLVTYKSSKNKNDAQTTQISLTQQKYFCHSQKKIIKLKIKINRLQPQYIRILKTQNKPWTIFSFSLTLFNLFFICDMVQDRILVSNLWILLNSPDQLSLYVFLEIVTDNRVQIKLAADSLQALGLQVDMRKAQQIFDTKAQNCRQYFQTLRLNRLARQKRNRIPYDSS